MIVLTRPAAAARRTAHELRQRGISAPILFSPVLSIEPVPGAELPEGGILVFTSENGVRAAEALGALAGRRAVAVGERTALAARRAGAECRALGGTAEALTRALIDEGGGPYHHLHGIHVTGDLVLRLSVAGLTADGRAIYNQIARPLTDAARMALEGAGPTILPLYSPRSARLVGSDLAAPPPATTVIAMSESIAESWPWTGGALIAKRTEGPAMLDLIARSCATGNEQKQGGAT